MKAKIIAHAILWAALLIAATLLFRHHENYWMMFLLLVTSASTSIAILDRRECPEKKRVRTDDESGAGTWLP